MNIYVPYVLNRNRSIRPELINLVPHATFVNLTDNDYGYFSLVTRLWAKKEDFLLIEQDNLPLQRDIDLMESCPNSWCVCPYKGPIQDGKQIWIGGFGCVRFRKHLIEQVPNFAQEVANSYSPSHQQYHWLGLDWAVTKMLRRRHVQQCWHHAVEHLHQYSRVVQ